MKKNTIKNLKMILIKSVYNIDDVLHILNKTKAQNQKNIFVTIITKVVVFFYNNLLD